MNDNVVIVSACLVGENCRYNAEIKKNQALLDKLQCSGLEFVPVCPEVLGGLSTPRPAAEIHGGDGYNVLRGAHVLTIEGSSDVTEKILSGAKKTLAIAKDNGANLAVLKERSPSCATHSIYKDGKIVPGVGVTTALLMENQIIVISDEDFIISED